MANKSDTAIWKEEANKMLQEVRERYEKAVKAKEFKHKEAALEELKELTPLVREHKTKKGRSGVYYDTIVERIRKLMADLDYEELAHKKTFLMRKPCLTMGKDETGREKYDSLVKAYGLGWVRKNVTVEKWHFPRTKVKVKLSSIQPDGKYRTTTRFETEKAQVVTTYTFIGKGSTKDMLLWTEKMGNTVAITVSDIPDRVKKGMPRSGQAEYCE